MTPKAQFIRDEKLIVWTASQWIILALKWLLLIRTNGKASIQEKPLNLENNSESGARWCRSVKGLIPRARSVVWPWTGICRKISIPKVLLLFDMTVSSALWIKPYAQDIAEKTHRNLLLASQLPEAAISVGAKQNPGHRFKRKMWRMRKRKGTLKSSHIFLCIPRQSAYPAKTQSRSPCQSPLALSPERNRQWTNQGQFLNHLKFEGVIHSQVNSAKEGKRQVWGNQGNLLID